MGEYKFCFDNYFSSISAKTVFFSVVATNGEAGWIQDPDSFGDIDFDKLEMEEHLDMRVEDIKVGIYYSWWQRYLVSPPRDVMTDLGSPQL